MVRPSLSILDPASAIFFAALITSDVFLRGPLPLRTEGFTVCYIHHLTPQTNYSLSQTPFHSIITLQPITDTVALDNHITGSC